MDEFPDNLDDMKYDNHIRNDMKYYINVVRVATLIYNLQPKKTKQNHPS